MLKKKLRSAKQTLAYSEGCGVSDRTCRAEIHMERVRLAAAMSRVSWRVPG